MKKTNDTLIKGTNVLICILIFISLHSCSNNKKHLSQDNFEKQNELKEQKAKQLINVFLKDTLLYFNTYQPVKYSKLDSSFTNNLDDTIYRKLMFQVYSIIDSFDLLKEQIGSSKLIYKNNNNIESDSTQLKTYLFQMDSLGNQMRLISNSFSKKFYGWKLEFQFQVQNVFMVNTTVNSTYYFDSSLSRIIKYQDDYSLDKFYRTFEQKNIKIDLLKRHMEFKSLKLF